MNRLVLAVAAEESAGVQLVRALAAHHRAAGRRGGADRRGVPLLLAFVDQAARDPAAIPRRSQDLARRRVYRRRDVPFDGRLPWQRDAATLDRFVRAADFHPLPSPWGDPVARLRGESLGIAKVAGTADGPPDTSPGTVVGTAEDGGVIVACGTGALVVTHVRREGRVLPAWTALVPPQVLE